MLTTKAQLKTLVRGAYDMQKLRIQTGNRVIGNFRAKLGQAPGKKASDTLTKEDMKVLSTLKKSHKRITDDLIASKNKGPFPGDEVISSLTELSLVRQYIELEKVEEVHFKDIKIALNDFPIYTEFLVKINGVGHKMSGVIISEFDIHKAKYPSSLHAYAGLDVAPDGKGRSRRKEHLVKRKYTDKDGKEKERDSVTFNPWLKTKLLGVLAASFMMQEHGKKADADGYKRLYYHYRHRIESNPNNIITDKPGYHLDNTWTKGRRDAAAKRYMIKMFLIDLYNVWRRLEGLEVAPTYQEAKLGHTHNKAA
jgi:hypothetical protein